MPDGSDPRLHLQVQYKAADAETLVLFLESLRLEFDENVILIWDGLPAHRCTKVTEHIEQQRAWLTAYRLPAYAPELNPVEYLWAAMKNKHTANVGDSTIDQLSDRIERAYNRYSSESLTLQGFLKASKLYDKTIHNS
jgi:transposase